MLQYLIYINLFLAILIFVFLLYAVIISSTEKESLAVNNLLPILIFVPAFFVALSLINYQYKAAVLLSFDTLILLTSVIFLIPYKTKLNLIINRKAKIDERDTMFSRAKLERESKEYEEYYNKNPEKKETDDMMRENPGLLNERSLLYNEKAFKATESLFHIPKYLSYYKIPKNHKLSSIPESEISSFIKKWMLQLGANSLGFTKLEDYHKYSYRGRKRNYGEKINNNHKFAIAITTEMDNNMIKAAPFAPTVMESANQYVKSAVLTVVLADFITSLGYNAEFHIDGNYDVVCPLVARDAGLGEIGRMGLLMTPEHGPRVRIGVITTDMELPLDKETNRGYMIDFCEKCKKCAENCPSDAISFETRENIDGSLRWQINQEKCFEYWTEAGTDCARCISVCPFSHPNNFLHNIIRKGIKNNKLFSNTAYKLDDLIYGRKPAPAENSFLE